MATRTDARWLGLGAVLLLVLSGCTPNMEQMRARFQYSLDGDVGSTMQYLLEHVSYVSTTPTVKKKLANGDSLYVFHDYWPPGDIRRNAGCDVYYEVRGENEVIVAAYGKGAGCYMPY